MADTPQGNNEDWGCIDLPFIGRVCASDVVDYVTSGNNGNGGFVRNTGDTRTISTDPIGNGNGSSSTFHPTPGCAPVLPVAFTQRAVAPRGYVVVTDPATGQKVAMLKSVARACRLWKAPRKPPIKASDWRCLMRAEATVKKLDRVVKAANKVSGKANLTRSRRSR